MACIEARGLRKAFGTTIALDGVNLQDGAYLGGAIAPGVETSAEALFSKAARLSKVDLEPPSRAIGRPPGDHAGLFANSISGKLSLVV